MQNKFKIKAQFESMPTMMTQQLHLKKKVEEIKKELHTLNDSTRTKVSSTLSQFPPIDLSIHMRFYENHDYTTRMEHFKHSIPKAIEENNIEFNNIFILSDHYDAVLFAEQYFNKPVYSLCPKEFNAEVHIVRQQSPLTVVTLLTEVECARNTKYFIGTHNSGVSSMIKRLRDKNSFLI